jgi:hypothetical protein
MFFVYSWCSSTLPLLLYQGSTFVIRQIVPFWMHLSRYGQVHGSQLRSWTSTRIISFSWGMIGEMCAIPRILGQMNLQGAWLPFIQMAFGTSGFGSANASQSRSGPRWCDRAYTRRQRDSPDLVGRLTFLMLTSKSLFKENSPYMIFIWRSFIGLITKQHWTDWWVA